MTTLHMLFGLKLVTTVIAIAGAFLTVGAAIQSFVVRDKPIPTWVGIGYLAITIWACAVLYNISHLAKALKAAGWQ